MRERIVYREIATTLDAIRYCAKQDQTDPHWPKAISRHEERANQLTRDHMPSGSGIDNGTTLDIGNSKNDKLVFYTSYHHMDDGMYDGWTDHVVTVTPSFVHTLNIRISGSNRNDIKEYLHEVFLDALTHEIGEE